MLISVNIKAIFEERMLLFQRIFLLLAIIVSVGCSHPLEVSGQGDILSITGARDCTLEQSQCSNIVVGQYKETYSAVPREGYRFVEWQGCGEQFPECSFNIPASVVRKNYFKSMPPLIAVFEVIPNQPPSIRLNFPVVRSDKTIILSPNSNARYSGNKIDVTGYISDTEGDSVSLSVYGSGGPINPIIDENGFWRAEDVLIPSGERFPTILAIAQDSAGGYSQLTIELQADLAIIAPRLLLELPGSKLIIFDRKASSFDIVSYDVNTRVRSVISSLPGDSLGLRHPHDAVLDKSGSNILVVDSHLRGVFAINLATGERTVVSDDLTGEGVLFEIPRGMALDVDNDRLLVVDSDLNALVSVDLTSGDRTVVSNSGIGTGPSFSVPFDVELFGERIFVTDIGLDALIEVDVTNGNRIELSGANVGEGVNFISPATFISEPDTNSVLVFDDNLDSFVRVDLTTGNRTVTTAAVTDSIYSIFNPSSFVINDDKTEVFIIDNNANRFLTVDLTTQEKTYSLDNGVGSGELIQSSLDMALDEVTGQIYVLDERLGESDVIVAVSSVTGNRTIISGATRGTGDALSSAKAMVFDQKNDRFLVVDSHLDAVFSVDRKTGARTIVSGDDVGNGDDYKFLLDIAIDPDNNNIAYLVDASADAIFKLDIITGNRVMLSGLDVGLGDEFDFANGVIVDKANNRLIVADSGGGFIVDSGFEKLISVDLDTGNRTLFYDVESESERDYVYPFKSEYIGSDSTFIMDDLQYKTLFYIDVNTGDFTVISNINRGRGDTFSRISSSAYDKVNNRIVVLDSFLKGIFAVDIESGDRSIISH
jgi:sugar lactone lactonase YvrE